MYVDILRNTINQCVNGSRKCWSNTLKRTTLKFPYGFAHPSSRPLSYCSRIGRNTYTFASNQGSLKLEHNGSTNPFSAGPSKLQHYSSRADHLLICTWGGKKGMIFPPQDDFGIIIRLVCRMVTIFLLTQRTRSSGPSRYLERLHKVCRKFSRGI